MHVCVCSGGRAQGQWGLPGRLPGRGEFWAAVRGRHRLYRPEEAGWSEAQVSLLEPVPLATPSSTPAPPPTILPAAPFGQKLCSIRLCSTLLSCSPGRPPPPCPPPPSSCCHHSPLISLRGWGPQGWTHPTVAPEPSWLDGRKVGRRTPEPRGGQCARVPRSLLKVSAIWGYSHSGVLETYGAHLRPFIPDFRPQSRLCPRCT